jgi:hypothetical protein
MADEKIAFNGIDGNTGKYLTPPMTPAELKEWDGGILPPPPPPEDPAKKKNPFRKPMTELEHPWDLSETGWGVVFPPGIDRKVRLALEELLEHRRRDATRRSREYFRDDLKYKTGDSVLSFLRNNGAPAGIADADRLPYYLLLVGDPEKIPYRFQSELDLHYGVGRIYFENPADYQRYAESLVAAESGNVRLPRRLTFFGPHNPEDDATRDTSQELIRQLADTVLEPGVLWEVRSFLGEEAQRSLLARLLGGDETPGLLFAACHGLGFPWGDDRQLLRQGALVCQDWPGPKDETGIKRSHYFTAEDLPAEASLRGLVAFLYACHSLGTPSRDNVPQDTLGKPETIADHSFVSLLPQRLLAHPKGGALAVIGHVDRALTASFLGSSKGEAVDPFRNFLRRLLKGHTVSWAMEYLNQAYAAYASQFAGDSEARTRREELDNAEFLYVWRLKNDLRNFAVFGDPAVRLLGRRE